MTVADPAGSPTSRSPLVFGLGRRPRRVLAALGLLVLAGVHALLRALGISTVMPDSWNIGLATPVNEAQSWVRDNRSTHWLFQWIVGPIGDGLRWLLESVEDLLLWLPWFVIPLIGALIVARSRRIGPTVVTALSLSYAAMFGLWEQSMQTLALMIVSVAVSVAIGIPLGVMSALHPRIDRFLRPTLDAMQTVPSTVYLLPVVLLFSIGVVPAAIATVIYALPPVVRLTALGITGVPASTVEAGTMFGSTPRQLLWKVQLPQATGSIITGINQTIMMALGIVVIATLVGAGGLGQEIQRTLQLRSPGRGLISGLGIVALALALDRLSRSFLERPGVARPSWKQRAPVLVAVFGGLVAAIVLGRAMGWASPTFGWDSSIADPVDDAVLWVRDHISGVTRWINDTLVRDVLIRSRDLLTKTLSWPIVIATAAGLAWLVRGWKLAVFTVIGLLAIGVMGLWVLAIDTLVQTIVAVVLATAIAVPIGIRAGRSKRVEALLSPVLDALQTVPSLIYTIPFVMLFTVSPVPGILASVLYAIPAGIKITALGIREVQGEALEASRSFGATERQTLWGVQVPLALPSIVLAVNQIIMMVLAMVIIAGMVGGGALGFKAVEALTRSNTGLGVEVGLAVVIMAVILDRLTQGAADLVSPPRS
jgi:glycine betaine/proline transport system permease protein